MRTYAIWLLVILMSGYSWKDWFKGACVLILMMAIFERPDMPKAVMGIPGLNPWNFLFLNVVGSAYFKIRADKNKVSMPRGIKNYLLFYLFFIFLAFFREVGDRAGMIEWAQVYGSQALSLKGLIIEDLFNTIKYAIPGLLLFYGCNSTERLKMGIGALLLMNFVIALQIVKAMPLSYLTDGFALEARAIRVIDRDIGYYRSDAAIFLGGAAWAIYAGQYMFRQKSLQLGMMAASGLTVMAVALTGGRIGQGAWIVVGGVLAWYKWRRFFLIGPIAVVVLVAFVPSVQDRFTQGFSADDEDDKHIARADSQAEGQLNSITSGRTIIWPHVINKILEAPFFGYGRRAMKRTGLSLWLGQNYNQPFPHPHNAYLQLFFDNGFILGLPIIFFHIIVLRRSLKLLREKDDVICITIGALGTSSLTSFLIGAIGQQSFYPVASSVGMLCTVGLVLRTYREKYNIGDNPEKLETHISKTWNAPENTGKKNKNL